jgi:AcrR family transcriptional regulator
MSSRVPASARDRVTERMWERWPLQPETGTRAAIVEAAWELARRGDIREVTVQAVAEAAGVSRQAVYLHFGSRAGLLVAMLRHHDAKSRFVHRLARDLRRSPSRESVEVWIRHWCRYLPQLMPVASPLAVEGIRDDAARAAFQDRMEHQLAGLRITFTALAEDGHLNPAWSPEQAADYLWSLLHVDSYRHLVDERGWRPAAFTERLVDVAQRLFLD